MPAANRLVSRREIVTIRTTQKGEKLRVAAAILIALCCSASLIAQTTAPAADPKYDALLAQLLAGDPEGVYRAIDPKMEPGYRLLSLRARAAWERFGMYAWSMGPQHWPDEKEAAKFRTLAAESTAALEDAYRAARTPLDKACVYADWQNRQATFRYEGDSKLLRDANPVARPLPKTPEVTARMNAARDVARKALVGVNPVFNGKMSVTDRHRDRFAQIVADEYGAFAAIGLTESLHNEILRDLPVFAKDVFGFRLSLVDKSQEAIRFHLWCAITAPTPEPAERAMIEGQINQLCDLLKANIDDKVKPSEVLPNRPDSAAVLRNGFEKYRDNRFAAYFRRPIPAWCWLKSGFTDRSPEELLKRFQTFNLSNLDDLQAEWTAERRKTPADLQQFRATALMVVRRNATESLRQFWDAAGTYQPPGGLPKQRSGTWTEIVLYAQDVSQITPLGPFPLKKKISADD